MSNPYFGFSNSFSFVFHPFNSIKFQVAFQEALFALRTLLYYKILQNQKVLAGHLCLTRIFLILFITSSLRGHLLDLFLRNFLRFSFHSHSFCKFLAESEYDCTKDSYNCTDSDEERHFASFFIKVNEDHVKSSSY